jgi:hypothetical protein
MTATPLQQNNSIAVGHQTFVRDILDSTDPVERQLSRLEVRVLGLVAGIAGPFFADASVDREKSAFLQSLLAHLEHTVATTENEKSQLSIQKHIYSNIKGYTDRAQIIKLVSGISFSIATIAFMYAFVAENYLFQNSSWGEFATQVTMLGLGSFGISVVHRYTAGSQLQAANKELVLRTVKV